MRAVVSCGNLWEGHGGSPSLYLLRFSMRHEYGPIPKILELAPGALISNLGEDRGRSFEGGGGVA